MVLSFVSILAAAPLVTAPIQASADASSQVLPDPYPALAEWRELHGPNWSVRRDRDTGWAEMIYGGRAAPPYAPRDDRDRAALAIRAMEATRGIHGVDPATLELDYVLFLPLGQIGSTDKETVRFRQRIDGVPVVDGFVNVLLAEDGSLLSIQSRGLPGVSSLPLGASLSARRAENRAVELFQDLFGTRPTRLGEPELVVDQETTDTPSRVPRLCWQVDAWWAEPDFQPDGRTFWIDAGNGNLVRSTPNVHNFDVGGVVSSMATPGTDPDTSSNPEVPFPMPYLRVDSAAGTTFTDANGFFVYPGVSGPLSCTFTYVGSFNDVTNTIGPDHSVTQVLQTGTGNSVLMNPSSAATVTSQANVFRVVDLQRDFVRSINPVDSTMDFIHSSFVNLLQTCNAYYDGGGINFFSAGGPCVNTAYSTVISHEDGHWGNQRYGTGNGGDGMGEGNADVWAMYLWDTPIMGAGFSGPGSMVRTGNNTRQFCGDCCGGCYGEVHADGQVWMGAAWKVRNYLNVSNGNAMGDLIANTIFLTWMEAYDQTQIKTVIETQWLTLDDDDGNINDGTPHFADIDQGFRDQGFPGQVLLPLSYGDVTEVDPTEIEMSAQPVFAKIYANASPPLTSTVLRYRVDGGPFQDLPMSSVGNDRYTATIPGQPAPAFVEYYVTATDSAARVATYPPAAPEALVAFDVGRRHVLLADDFEGAGDAGWTHGTYGDTGNSEDDWDRLFPRGKSGTSGGIAWADPYGPYEGARCWSNDPGLGSNNGAYSANVHNWLRSPPIDCSAAVGTSLRFKRWLNVQGSASDQARVRVNGTIVYSNPATNLVDTDWATQWIDISAIADGQPSVQVEFELKSNGTTQLGGWQVDDLEVVWVEVADCPTPEPFCKSIPNSVYFLGAEMSYSGTTLVSNNDLVLLTDHCPPNKLGLYFYGQGEVLVPFGNGVRCVASPIRRLPTLMTDANGHASYALDLNNLPANGQIHAGEIWGFQLWHRDPAAGGAYYTASDALRVVFCP